MRALRVKQGRPLRIGHVLTILIFSASVLPAVAADKNSPKPAGKLSEIKELPNPFTFSDGSPVSNRDDWARRRDELKDLFQDYMYGHLPGFTALRRPELLSECRGFSAVFAEDLRH